MPELVVQLGSLAVPVSVTTEEILEVAAGASTATAGADRSEVKVTEEPLPAKLVCTLPALSVASAQMV